MPEIERDYYKPDELKVLWDPLWLPRRFGHSSTWYGGTTPLEAMNPRFDTYHPYVCQVCKRGPFTKGVKTSRCSRCKVVRYCCADHQKKDFSDHKQWCKAYAAVMASDDFKFLPVARDKESWVAHTKGFHVRLDLDRRVTLPFHSMERQIAAMQPRCRKCFVAGTELNPNDLIICPTCCGVALCRTCYQESGSLLQFHPDGGELECDEHALSLACSGMIVEQGNPLNIPSITDCSDRWWVPKDWIDYFGRKRNDFGFMVNSLLEMAPVTAFITDGLSTPLTIHMVLHKHLNYFATNRESNKLIVHVAGAGMSDGVMERYVELLRLNSHVNDFFLVLIGPDMPTQDGTKPFEPDGESPIRASCRARWTTKGGLYHDVAKDLDEPPTIIICPHSGIMEHVYTPKWRDSFAYIKEKNIPCIITGYNIEEVIEDAKHLRDWGLNIVVPPTANPFRGLRPYPDPFREPVDMIYGHSAYAVVQGSS